MPVETHIAPWIVVSSGARAVEYYTQAFGAVEVYRLDGDDGGVAVAQLTLGGSSFWVQEDDAAAPAAAGGPVRMIVTTEDPDALFERAIAAGATQVFGMSEQYGWRTGRVTDPFGHDWEFSRQLDE